MKAKILVALLNGKIVKLTSMSCYGLRKTLYVLKDGELYSKSSFYNDFGNVWIKCNELNLSGHVEIIEDYCNHKDKFVN